MYNIYNSILRAISNQERIQDIEHYLWSLRSYVESLRRGYRNSLISVDYSSFNVQAAYLLAYYPLYVEMTHKILEELFQNAHPFFAQKRELQACFLGGGPAPEAAALSIYLKRSVFQARSVVAHTFDIAANTWSRSREVSKQLVSELASEIQFSLHGYPLNLCQRNAFPPLRDIIQTSDLFIVQNCLNEFANTRQVFVENIEFLVQEMPAGSILIMADLKYDSAENLMRRVESCLANRAELQVIRSHAIGYCCLRSKLLLPGVVTRNLLTGTGDLVPKRKVEFNYLALQKLPLAVQPEYIAVPQYDNIPF